MNVDFGMRNAEMNNGQPEIPLPYTVYLLKPDTLFPCAFTSYLPPGLSLYKQEYTPFRIPKSQAPNHK
jgi:hypothetical protein